MKDLAKDLRTVAAELGAMARAKQGRDRQRFVLATQVLRDQARAIEAQSRMTKPHTDGADS